MINASTRNACHAGGVQTAAFPSAAMQASCSAVLA